MGYEEAFFRWAFLIATVYVAYYFLVSSDKKLATKPQKSKLTKLGKQKQRQKQKNTKKDTLVNRETPSKKSQKLETSDALKSKSKDSSKKEPVVVPKKGTPKIFQENHKVKKVKSPKKEKLVGKNPAEKEDTTDVEDTQKLEQKHSTTPSSLKMKSSISLAAITADDSLHNSFSSNDIDDGFQTVTSSRSYGKKKSTEPLTKRQRQNQQKKLRAKEMQELADEEQRRRLAAHRKELHEANRPRGGLNNSSRSAYSYINNGQAGSSKGNRYDSLW
ncbi:hypothetical protein POMI540_1519 [Schizosaccharomyces pombe]|uniref:Uncharacterized protein C13E7.07 n=1 Tax=Schizosaccharomyces pombe (strain 972 / ATCC 24843) TaxID=284812 RepID=YOH7_SCHPO|nr:uncharacterized protein SPBC13E7.07 [Schizosaccharomyces pombe]Q9P6R3.1 RecName: Full=Uncharacterized protein C13E7.07 [Schizosaccharomyces pombe 972h-]CAB89882.1 sequence orphan [Schizosaccharomyces pombe]|eukprot:NP_596262.1 uncharacterized protein SPBC13E7.07 [Schizosaccharomyces pombe]